MDANKCESIMQEYLFLDKNQILPLKITMHLLSCKKCRSEVRMLSKAQKISAAPLMESVSPDDASIKMVMNKLFSPNKVKPISLTRWAISGILMLLLLLVFGLASRNLHNQDLQLAFYLIFAGIITVYGAMFIGCNLDFFVKKIDSFSESRKISLA